MKVVAARVSAGVTAVLATLTVAAALAPAAGAETRYAAPDGDGPPASCPKSNPCSLVDAIEDPAVANGDRVKLASGRYDALPNGVTVDDDVTVGGSARKPPHLVGSADPMLSIESEGAVVSSVQVTHKGDKGQAVLLGGGRLEQALVSSTEAAGCDIVGPAEIRNSVCSATGDAAIRFGIVGLGVEAKARLNGVTAWRFGTGPALETGAIGAGSVADLRLRNTIVRGKSSDDIVAVTDSSPDVGAIVAARNSSFASTSATGAGASVPKPGGGSNQKARPRLVKPGKGDFRQRGNSPTIDAGGSAPGARDYLGGKRKQGRRADIGAQEAIDSRKLLKLPGKSVRAADTLKLSGRCPISKCTVSGKATLLAGGEQVRLKLKKDRAKKGGRVRFKVKLFPGAGPILSALGGKLKVRAKVKAPLGFKAKVGKTYKIR